MTFSRLCRLAPAMSIAGVDLLTGRDGCSGCLSGFSEKPAGDGGRICHEFGGRAVGDHFAAALARARPEIDHVRGAADRVFVVLDHEQRVALGLQLLERVEQDAVVARMQADGRLVEDVAHAAQVGAELRREPDALRFAARQRRRRAVEREIRQPDLVQKIEPRFQFGDEVARDFGFPAFQRDIAEHRVDLADGEPGDIGDRIVAIAHARAPRDSGACHRMQGRSRRPRAIRSTNRARGLRRRFSRARRPSRRPRAAGRCRSRRRTSRASS